MKGRIDERAGGFIFQNALFCLFFNYPDALSPMTSFSVILSNRPHSVNSGASFCVSFEFGSSFWGQRAPVFPGMSFLPAISSRSS